MFKCSNVQMFKCSNSHYFISFFPFLQPFHLSGHGLSLNASPSSTNTLTNGLSSWNPDIDDALAADFDGSLSGLGMEAGTNPYNMR
jgi:hypothetical protein